MVDRLSAADVAYLYLEGPTTPQHVGTVMLLDARDGFDYERLIRLLDERIALVPRYRQRLRPVPGRLANPVWVDDPSFDIGYHVRRSAVPRPGDDAVLWEFCGRVLARPLDRQRPLWEMYLVEGLQSDRVAVVAKTHPSMIDGGAGIDIVQVLLDQSPQPRRVVEPVWLPARQPSPVRLVLDAMVATARRPVAVVDAVRLSAADARSTTRWLTGSMAALTGAVADVALARERRTGPLQATLGAHRRVATARVPLADLRAVRAKHGGSVHDVVLATVAGALREWLLARDEPLRATSTVRALVPVSVRRDADAAHPEPGARVVALLVDLPVGEPEPVRRLTRIRYAMAGHDPAGRHMGADALVAMSGFAPPTLQSLGARAAHGLTRRTYSLAITNTPGPQVPLYAAGVRMTELYPVPPITEGHALAVGLTSYAGTVCFAVNADRDAVPDAALIAEALPRAVDELRSARSTGTARAPRRRSQR